jgi:hypothetical protein
MAVHGGKAVRVGGLRATGGGLQHCGRTTVFGASLADPTRSLL